MDKIKVMLADDDERMNNLRMEFLSKIEYVEICGVALDGDEEIKLIEEKHPDIAITDNRMPNKNGTEVIEIITNTNNTEIIPKFIIVSSEQLLQYMNGSNKYVIDIISKVSGCDNINERIFKNISEEFEFRNREVTKEMHPKIIKENWLKKLIKFFKKYDK